MADDRIELYVGLLDALDTPQSSDACWAALSAEERRRAGLFAFDRHRRQYIFAHGLLRFALSNVVAEVEPSDWLFTTDGYGRPFVTGPQIAKAVYFSLSHTEGCVACVISGHEAVGVDVEEVRSHDSLMEMAASVFSADEIDVLQTLPAEEFAGRFFDYWTLKEAYLKARGSGLSFPLDQFSMLVTSGEIGIRFAPGVEDDARRWRFTLDSPSPVHRLAIADGAGVAGGLPVVHRSLPAPLGPDHRGPGRRTAASSPRAPA